MQRPVVVMTWYTDQGALTFPIAEKMRKNWEGRS